MRLESDGRQFRTAAEPAWRTAARFAGWQLLFRKDLARRPSWANCTLGASRLLALVALMALSASFFPLAAEPRPPSILVLDQAEVTSPFNYSIYGGLRSVVASDRSKPISVYVVNLDLDRFNSDIRFPELGPWDRSRWEIIAIAAVTLLQALLIIGLLYQHRRWRAAQVEARRRVAELAHMNRQATVGQLSAAIAHELNQPLGAILNNVETAALLVNAPSLNRQELKAILTDIKRDDQRATEVIRRLRRLLTHGVVDRHEVDVNDVIRDVFSILSAQAAAREVKIDSKLAQQRLWVNGDRVQLEQVILNLVVNGIEAIADTSNGLREIVCRSWASDGMAVVSIRDSGPGIPQNQFDQLFEPFFTTKTGGMGMGLCIARKIVEAHGGTIMAERRCSGAVFLSDFL
jgi:signal transduction histidine kinase